METTFSTGAGFIMFSTVASAMIRCSLQPLQVTFSAASEMTGSALKGSASSKNNILDGGDGDDFVGATSESSWLLGGTGNDMLQAVGDSNAWLAAMATINCRRMAPPTRWMAGLE